MILKEQSVFLDDAGRSNGLYFDKSMLLLHALMSIISYGRSALIEKNNTAL